MKEAIESRPGFPVRVKGVVRENAESVILTGITVYDGTVAGIMASKGEVEWSAALSVTTIIVGAIAAHSIKKKFSRRKP